jgi:hypothetical protein
MRVRLLLPDPAVSRTSTTCSQGVHTSANASLLYDELLLDMRCDVCTAIAFATVYLYLQRISMKAKRHIKLQVTYLKNVPFIRI